MSGIDRPFRMPMLVWITRSGSRLSGCPRPMPRTAPYVNRQSPLISLLQAHLLRNTLLRQLGVFGDKLKSQCFGLSSKLSLHSETSLLFRLREDAFVKRPMRR
jgi:hypothetical protein